jgi:hypothetical protein
MRGWLSANAYFVLNPTKEPCLDDLTVLDLVKLRRPQRLIINIGANNGFWLLAFQAAPLDTPTCGPDPEPVSANGVKRCDGSIRNLVGKHFLDDVRRLVTDLSNVEGLQSVYFNGLVRPTLSANLVPCLNNGEPGVTSALFRSNCVPQASADEADNFIEGDKGVNRSAASILGRLWACQRARTSIWTTGRS